MNQAEVALGDVGSDPDRPGEGEGEDGFAGLQDRAALASASEDDSVARRDEVCVSQAALGLDEHGFLLAEHSAAGVDVFTARADHCEPERGLGVIDVGVARLNGLAALVDFFLADSAVGNELFGAREVCLCQVECGLALAQLCLRFGDFFGARAVKEAREIGGGVVAAGACELELIGEVALVERGDDLTGGDAVALVNGEGFDAAFDLECKIRPGGRRYCPEAPGEVPPGGRWRSRTRPRRPGRLRALRRRARVGAARSTGRRFGAKVVAPRGARGCYGLRGVSRWRSRSCELPFGLAADRVRRRLCLEAMEQEVEVGTKDSRGVERPIVMRAERVLPEGSEQEWADHAINRVLDIDGTEFTLFDAAAENGCDQVHSPMCDRVEIKAGELREVSGLCDDQLGDDAERRGDDTLPGCEQALEQQPGRNGLFEHGLEELDLLRNFTANDGFEKVFLAAVVQVDRSFRHAGPCGDVFEPGGGEAALAEALEGGGHDLRRPGLFPPLPARLIFRGHSFLLFRLSAPDPSCILLTDR